MFAGHLLADERFCKVPGTEAWLEVRKCVVSFEIVCNNSKLENLFVSSDFLSCLSANVLQLRLRLRWTFPAEKAVSSLKQGGQSKDL